MGRIGTINLVIAAVLLNIVSFALYLVALTGSELALVKAFAEAMGVTAGDIAKTPVGLFLMLLLLLNGVLILIGAYVLLLPGLFASDVAARRALTALTDGRHDLSAAQRSELLTTVAEAAAIDRADDRTARGLFLLAMLMILFACPAALYAHVEAFPGAHLFLRGGLPVTNGEVALLEVGYFWADQIARALTLDAFAVLGGGLGALKVDTENVLFAVSVYAFRVLIVLGLATELMFALRGGAGAIVWRDVLRPGAAVQPEKP